MSGLFFFLNHSCIYLFKAHYRFSSNDVFIFGYIPYLHTHTQWVMCCTDGAPVITNFIGIVWARVYVSVDEEGFTALKFTVLIHP